MQYYTLLLMFAVLRKGQGTVVVDSLPLFSRVTQHAAAVVVSVGIPTESPKRQDVLVDICCLPFNLDAKSTDFGLSSVGASSMVSQGMHLCFTFGRFCFCDA